MGKIKNENYIVIQRFMINELKLKGNDLMVYAIIYEFTQDGENRFEGSRQYLAEWCNSTTRGIAKNLESLVVKGLIEKRTVDINNVKFCHYRVVRQSSGVRRYFKMNQGFHILQNCEMEKTEIQKK